MTKIPVSQGLTADGAGNAVINVSEEAWLDSRSPFYGFRLIGFFYDEIFGALPVQHQSSWPS